MNRWPVLSRIGGQRISFFSLESGRGHLLLPGVLCARVRALISWLCLRSIITRIFWGQQSTISYPNNVQEAHAETDS